MDGLQAEGFTAVYDTLLDALRYFNPDGGISSIMVLSGGKVTRGAGVALTPAPQRKMIMPPPEPAEPANTILKARHESRAA